MSTQYSDSSKMYRKSDKTVSEKIEAKRASLEALAADGQHCDKIAQALLELATD